MSARRAMLAWLSFACLLLSAAGASAQVQVKPWFLVIVDTSGSMQDHCTNGATVYPGCVSCGTSNSPAPCTPVITDTSNSCGWTHTRINDAKCALRNILNSTGDAEFALMQFRHPCRPACDSRAGGDTATTCDADISVALSTSNYDLLAWVDGTCQGSCTGGVTQEIYAYGSTPIAGSLRRAQQYYAGTLGGFASPTATDSYAGCRPVGVIVLTDGDEACEASTVPPMAATALRTTTVPTPGGGSRSIDIKTYPIGFGLTPGYARIEAIATAGGTDAPGAYRGFYAQNEEDISSALNQIITNSQLSERCDGRDNDCDTRIDEDNAKFCDVRGIRTANPKVPSAADPSVLVDQAMVDTRVPACSGMTCPAVTGQVGELACAAPEWASSQSCTPINILCSSPGEFCDNRDDDCDGKVDEGAAPIAGSNEQCGDRLDNDCDGIVDEQCNTNCIAQPEICDGNDNDCDTRIDEGLTRACGTDLGECSVGVETCTASSWGGCSAVQPVAEACNNKDDDCDGVVDGFTMTCAGSNIGLCRSGTRTCTAGSFSSCTGLVGPASEVCDDQDNDCDNDPNDDGSQDSRVGQACGNTRGVCRPGMTKCDHGEILCVGATSGGTEICDNLDNDCDGNVDEGVVASDIRVNQPCIAPLGNVTTGPMGVQGQCRVGTSVCSGGMLICPGYVGPTLELCDNLDQDCDGNNINGVAMSDPRVGASCGTSVGECDPGQIICTSGGMLQCNAVQPQLETCNAKDDDCDGLTDENLPPTPTDCQTGNHGNVGECKIGREACLGGGIVCAGEVTPSGEVCDGKDNDCDNKIDEGDPGAGLPCGSSIGECRASMTICAAGRIQCPGSLTAGSELCDGLDNDCDGLTDEGNPEGGQACDTDDQGTQIIGACRTSVDPTQAALPLDQACGECRFGVRVCDGARLLCRGTVGSRFEVCDGLDNDCDSPCVLDNSDPAHPVLKCPTTQCQLPDSDPKFPGPVDCDAKIDEEVALHDMNVGVPCVGGSGECKSGTEQCVEGVLSCVGGQTPETEICNGKDDDCDTLVDEGFTVGAPCGTSVGECGQGVFACDAASGGMVCRNSKPSSAEICDGLDNDCNGVVDDGNPGGGTACGSDDGECKRGVEQCINGRLQCADDVEPSNEICDCLDNDCDGKVDEAPSATAGVCAGDGVCTMCQCAQPCRDLGEFAEDCPGGKVAVTENNRCLCVGERCSPTNCAMTTLSDADTVLCRPGSKVVGACVCKNNDCVARCNGVICAAGLICDDNDGTCKERSCLLAQFACASGEYCDITTLACAVDPCANASCNAEQACRDGDCLGSCAAVTCAEGERCHDGLCAKNLCQASDCLEKGQVCDPSTGTCVPPGLCVGTGCKSGYVCNEVSGSCDTDPCLRTTCPTKQVCTAGECAPRCTTPLVDCNDTCVNPANSREHCGASGDCTDARGGIACSSEQVCSDGVCTNNCKQGQLICDGGCVDPDSDRLHCGASSDCSGLNAGKVCATGTACRGGTCIDQTLIDNENAGTKTIQNRIATTGGGGCNCTVPGQVRSRELPSSSFLLLSLPLLLWRRRWSRALRNTRHVLLCLLAVFTGGCNVNTLCLNCVDDAGPDTGTGTGNGGGYSNDPDGSLPDGSFFDAGVLDASTNGDAGGRDAQAPCSDTEICNGLDDDCDGNIDESIDPAAMGIDTQTDFNNCGACGHRCVLDHSFSKCEGGECKIDGCDPEYVDFDGVDNTGCEYRCSKAADDDRICDRRDDDCDHKTDEDVDFMQDSSNCGSCGNTCQPLNATAAGYCDQGRCRLDAAKCNNGFVDADGIYENGCEYQCTASSPALELCNAKDDDCDRRIDEGVAESDSTVGASCGVSAGVCNAGAQSCIAGTLVCQGGRGPSVEVCNGQDDDCDGNTDESFPQRGLPCGTDTGECVRGNQQCAMGMMVCVGRIAGSVELCDGKDNDCDGATDETNIRDGAPQGVGQPCRTLSGGTLSLSPTMPAMGECSLGNATCVSGRLLCANEIGPQPELCDGKDQDCDGDLDDYTMTDPLLGSPCGTDVGECSFGVYVCNGSRVRTCDNSGGKLPVTETCNGKDDDCDGNYDETDANGTKPEGVGEPCRIDDLGKVHAGASETVQGECVLGTSVCSGGVIGCPGYVGNAPELCDGKDQDCDGKLDEGVASTDPAIGQVCPGNNVGTCRSGTSYCNAGVVVCQGPIVMPTPEVCDGLDNDCDGSLADDGADEPTVMTTTTCGTNIGACSEGVVRCNGGALQCFGAVSAMPEVCDSTPGNPMAPAADNDCDGKVDEDFQLNSNVNRCGSCSTACSFNNATARCNAGSCEIASCNPGYYDDRNVAGADCAVGPCTIAGNEICNGRDDDCDGSVDESLTPPAGVCNTLGACSGATATCGASSGWVCSKLPTTESCNDIDDNCNGVKDEGFPLGQSCAAPGQGACATPGTLKCTPDNTTTACVGSNDQPVVAGTPSNEVCNGVDDDCDGTVDEPCPTADNSCVTDDWISLGNGVEIYKYEASRPDATANTAGGGTARACSGANRLPWANLTYQQARTACDGAGPTVRLCAESEWEQACINDNSGSCTYGFPNYPACNTWVADQCNGVDYTSTPDIQASGKSGARDGCYRGPSNNAAQQIFEITGNVKEYVLQRDTGAIPVRGGASNNTQAGLRCDFDFSVWPYNTSFSNVGFRCCRGTALPTQCVTVQNTGLNVTNATLATHTLNVTLGGPITDLNVVNFTGTHNTMSQVDYIELVGPDNTVVRLLNQGYCGNNDNWSYTFDQEAGANLPVSNTSPCGNGGTYKAYQSLAAFYGKNPYGAWTIRVHDNSSGNSASSPHINSWGLRVCIDPN